MAQTQKNYKITAMEFHTKFIRNSYEIQKNYETKNVTQIQKNEEIKAK